MKKLFFILLIGILFGIAAAKIDWPALVGKLPEAPPPAATATPPVASYRPPVDYEEAIIKAVEKSSPAVVSIIITKDLPVIEQCPYSPFENLPPQFREFFGPFEFYRPCPKGTQRQEVGGGTGFIVTNDGMIVTNKHVVSDEEASYTVLTNDGNKYEAKVLARSPIQDLAVVKITKSVSSLPAVKLGDSDTVKLGQTVIAIGNALGEFRNTVSVGIVSGLARSLTASTGTGSEFLEGLIQTDAAINPGNSGGPLLNLRGEVIGINTAIASGAENIGFAIPINGAKRDIESVKISGKISIPFLGVRYLIITPEIAKRDKLPVEEGAVVRGGNDGPGIVPDSPAAKAGIKAEDIILKLNGVKINREHSLASLIQKYKVGDTIKLTILREGKEMEISLKLEERKF
jgi:serine protease Do